MGLRILAAADIHGKDDRLESLARAAQEHRPQLVVVAGDLASHGLARFAHALEVLERLAAPVWMVRGNSDPVRMEKQAAGFSNLFFMPPKKTLFKETPFVGVSGCVPLPFYSKCRLREQKLFSRLAGQVGPETVLVAHPPPRGLQDRVAGRFSAGSQALLALVAAQRPRLVICGHIHEDAGHTRLGDTLVVNCAMSRTSRGALISLDGDSVQTHML